MKIPVDQHLVKHSPLLTVLNLYDQTLTVNTQLHILKMSYPPIYKSLRLVCRCYDPFKYTGCNNHKWRVTSHQSIPSGCQSPSCVSPSLSDAFNRVLVSLITRTVHPTPELFWLRLTSMRNVHSIQIPLVGISRACHFQLTIKHMLSTCSTIYFSPVRRVTGLSPGPMGPIARR